MAGEDPYYHGHSYMLPMVFPAELVSRFHGPKEWLEQARATWRSLCESGVGNGTGKVGFGGQGVCEILRIGEAEAAFKAARFPEDSTDCPPNGLTRIWSWGPFQADVGPGVCRMLADMLLLGLDGVIHLFPGIPEGVPARFHSLRAPGAFLISAEKRTEEVDYVLVRSLAGGKLRIENPWPLLPVCISCPGREPAETKGARILEVSSRPGSDYLIAPSGADLAAIPIVDFALQQ